MPKATWHGVVLAESDHVEKLEANVYFPPESIHWEYFKESDYRTTCPWKGVASYYSIEVDGVRAPRAAWYYPDPSSAALHIKDHVAFSGGVQVETTESPTRHGSL